MILRKILIYLTVLMVIFGVLCICSVVSYWDELNGYFSNYFDSLFAIGLYIFILCQGVKLLVKLISKD